MFINFVKKQQEIVQETLSDDGNFQPSSAGNFPQSSSVASDDEALIDVSEDETGTDRWFNGLQVYIYSFFFNFEDYYCYYVLLNA